MHSSSDAGERGSSCAAAICFSCRSSPAEAMQMSKIQCRAGLDVQAHPQHGNGGLMRPMSPVQDLLQDVKQEVMDLQRRQAQLVCILAAGGPPPRHASSMAVAFQHSPSSRLQTSGLILQSASNTHPIVDVMATAQRASLSQIASAPDIRS